MVSIYGNINRDGDQHSGSSGFRVRTSGTGMYLITFDPPFKTMPALTLTQNYPDWDDFTSSGGKTTDNCTIVALSKNEAKIKTGGADGKASNRNFSFIAMGER